MSKAVISQVEPGQVVHLIHCGQLSTLSQNDFDCHIEICGVHSLHMIVSPFLQLLYAVFDLVQYMFLVQSSYREVFLCIEIVLELFSGAQARLGKTEGEREKG